MTSITRPAASLLKTFHPGTSPVEDALVILTPDGTMVFANESMGRLFGFTHQEAAGKKIDFTAGGKIEANTAERLWSSIRSSKKWQDTVRIRHQEGEESELDISSTALSLKGDPGHADGFLCVIRDITRKRQFENRMLNAGKMEAIGTLAGGIAHDFNNILSAVLGFSELVAMDAPPGGEIAENIQEVLTAGRRARDLVNQILLFSRQSASEPRPLLITPLVAEAAKMLRSSLPSKIRIKTNLLSRSAILADPFEVHQVLMNLCVNAGLAMDKSGGTLGVEVLDVDLDEAKASSIPGLSPGPHLLLSVSDTGVGMSMDVADRIFDPYFTTRDEGGGRGMGLSVVHGIVAGSGGSIEFESRENAGSTFRVYWPLYSPEKTSDKITDEEVVGGNERVLFVDDEDYQVSLAKKMLENLGYKVTALNCPLKALGLFKSDPDAFDLVITDMTMPSMSGKEMTKALHGIRPRLPVIVCTGYSLATIGREEYIGASALVAKPVIMKDMAKTIRRVLDSGKEMR